MSNVDNIARVLLDERDAELAMTMKHRVTWENYHWPSHQKLYEKAGKQLTYYTYVACLPVRCISPDTFLPKIGFKARYCIEIAGRVYRESDMQIEIAWDKIQAKKQYELMRKAGIL
jgi:hypothetical protein